MRKAGSNLLWSYCTLGNMVCVEEQTAEELKPYTGSLSTLVCNTTTGKHGSLHNFSQKEAEWGKVGAFAEVVGLKYGTSWGTQVFLHQASTSLTSPCDSFL